MTSIPRPRTTRPAGDLSWQDQAACRGSDADFYSDDPAEALEVCRSCPVRQACLDYATAAVEVHGVWGGTTPEERRRARVGRRRSLNIATPQDQSLVSAALSCLYLRALARIGWSPGAISLAAAAAGEPLAEETVWSIRRGSRQLTTPRVAAAIAALYPQLAEDPPRTEAAQLVASRARKSGWLDPDELADVLAKTAA